MRKLVIVFGLAFAIVACKKTETAAPATTATQSTATTAPTPAPQPSAAPPTTASAAPTAGSIASADGEKGGVRVDITELKRTSGGTVNLKFVITNSGSQELSFASAYLGESAVSADHYRDVSGVHLLDAANKKKYFVVTDSDRKCVCSKDIASVEPGNKVNLWAKFPAPPPEVTKVTVEIPHFAPIDDVPISQ